MSEGVRVAATGYGRVAVDYADFVITEITCHGRGGRELAGNECAIIDVGGQDTKVILVDQGMIQDFLMNDKCSAGTGKFLEIMANRLGVTIAELFDLAEQMKSETEKWKKYKLIVEIPDRKVKKNGWDPSGNAARISSIHVRGKLFISDRPSGM